MANNYFEPCESGQSYNSKRVIKLECKYCENYICYRGMKAILLADTSVELYSTDLPPFGAVELVGIDYSTANCSCSIRDVACSNCGNVVGYHVTVPCQSCLSSCNNGHFWMFHSESAVPLDRLNLSDKGLSVYTWATIPSCRDDPLVNPNAKRPKIECFR